MQKEVHQIIVVCGSESLTDDQFTCSSDHTVIGTVIGMFMQNTRIFLVNANCILYLVGITGAQIEVSVEVTDSTFAITSKSKRICHESCTILTEIESVFSSMWEIRTSVRDDHLSDRQTPEQWSDIAVIVVCDVIQDNTLTVVETDVKLPSDMDQGIEIP